MRSLLASLWAQLALTLCAALLGLGFWLWLALPLPFLFGPMVACILLALAGLPVRGFGKMTEGARTVLGLSIGLSVTPALLAQLPQMASSLALVAVYVLLTGLLGVPFFRRFCGFDRVTAFYAAMPGGATDMIMFGKEAGADVRALSLIHATRVAVIVTLAPLVLWHVYGASLDRPAGPPLSSFPLPDLAIMALAALAGWQIARRIGLFGASVLGPMIAGLVLSLSNIIDMRVPAEAIELAQFVIGVSIGAHYIGVTLRELRKTIAMGALFMMILILLSGGIAEIAVLLGLASGVDALLAFAPGGQAEMAVLALMVGADIGFVALHHVFRILLVLVGTPIAARWMMKPR